MSKFFDLLDGGESGQDGGFLPAVLQRGEEGPGGVVVPGLVGEVGEQRIGVRGAWTYRVPVLCERLITWVRGWIPPRTRAGTSGESLARRSARRGVHGVKGGEGVLVRPGVRRRDELRGGIRGLDDGPGPGEVPSQEDAVPNYRVGNLNTDALAEPGLSLLPPVPARRGIGGHEAWHTWRRPVLSSDGPFPAGGGTRVHSWRERRRVRRELEDAPGPGR